MDPQDARAVGSTDASLFRDGVATGEAESACPQPPATLTDGGLPVLGAAFAAHYVVTDLGLIAPGVPGQLGGLVVDPNEPNTLLFAGQSDTPTGGIYAVGLVRDACGHVIGVTGAPRRVADTPHVDASLIFGTGGVLLYSKYNVDGIGQLLPGATAPSRETPMSPLGVGTPTTNSLGGIGIVPPGLAAAGAIRALTFRFDGPGDFYHVDAALAGGLYSFSSGQKVAELPGGPGGFSYVPAGSPGFSKPALIVSEWLADRVSTYDVDVQGDPILASRRDFLESFRDPWGAHFEPITGDFLFLAWGPNRLYVVRGFSPPPPPPPPPR